MVDSEKIMLDPYYNMSNEGQHNKNQKVEDLKKILSGWNMGFLLDHFVGKFQINAPPIFL